MRQKLAIRLLSSAALAAVLSLAALGGANAEDAAKKDEAGTSVIFDPDSVNTLLRRVSGCPHRRCRSRLRDGDRTLQEGAADRARQSGDPPAPDDLAASERRHQGWRQVCQRPEERSDRRAHHDHRARHGCHSSRRIQDRRIAAEIYRPERSRPHDERPACRLGARRRRHVARKRWPWFRR